MPIIKLDAIDSTNDYLKQLSKEKVLENYIIVMANEQTKGKGQMGAEWLSEKGKNLTMSILINNVGGKQQNIFAFNSTVALAVAKVLKNSHIPNVTIKWPNDIMADSKKVAGILIENTLKSDGSFTAVVGIGLNLNQTFFENLPQATSLSCITGKIYVPEKMAVLLAKSLEENLLSLTQNSELLWEEYQQKLFKKNVPVTFEDKKGKRFMGIIKKVTHAGKLEVLLNDDSLVHYEVKEIKMLF